MSRRGVILRDSRSAPLPLPCCVESQDKVIEISFEYVGLWFHGPSRPDGRAGAAARRGAAHLVGAVELATE